MQGDEVVRELKRSFSPEEVKWRILESGLAAGGRVWAKASPYITKSSIIERLDSAAGPLNWRDSYTSVGSGVCCTLEVRIAKEWIGKSDGAGEKEPSETKGGLKASDGVKAGFTDAFKRAAAKWGIGAELYERKDYFAVISEKGRYHGRLKDGTAFSWDPPALPAKVRMKPAAEKKENESTSGAFTAEPEEASPSFAQPKIRFDAGKLVFVSDTEPSARDTPAARGIRERRDMERQIGELLKSPPFTKEDWVTAVSVVPKISSLQGLRAYKKQWEEEKAKKLQEASR